MGLLSSRLRLTRSEIHRPVLDPVALEDAHAGTTGEGHVFGLAAVELLAGMVVEDLTRRADEHPAHAPYRGPHPVRRQVPGDDPRLAA